MMRRSYVLLFFWVGLCVSLSLAFGLFTPVGQAEAAPNITYFFDKSEVFVGDTVTVTVRVDNAPDLVGASVYLEFGGTGSPLVTLVDESGDWLKSPTVFSTSTPGAVWKSVYQTTPKYILSVNGVRLASGGTLPTFTSGTLMTFQVTATGEGTVTFKLAEGAAGLASIVTRKDGTNNVVQETPTATSKTLTIASGTRPSAPTGLTAKITDQGVIEWSWQYSGSGISGFKLYDENGVLTDTVSSSARTLKKTGLANGTYKRTIRAYTTSGSTQIESASSTQYGITMQSLASPGNFAGTAESSQEIRWTWVDNSYDEDGFKLYDSNGNLLAKIDANQTSYNETGLSRGKTYTRYIRAYKGSELGEKSAGVSVTTTNTSSGTTETKVADAVNDALGVSASSSDVYIVESSETDQQTSYRVSIDKDQVVAFPPGSMDRYLGSNVTITTTDVEVRIPAKWLLTFSTDTGSAFRLKEVTDLGTTPYGTVKVGSTYDLNLIRYSQSNSDGWKYNTFSSEYPVTIVFNYPSTVINPSSLRVYTRDSSSSIWTLVGGEINTTDRTIRVSVEHFSQYALFETASGTLVPGYNQGSAGMQGDYGQNPYGYYPYGGNSGYITYPGPNGYPGYPGYPNYSSYTSYPGLPGYSNYQGYLPITGNLGYSGTTSGMSGMTGMNVMPGYPGVTGNVGSSKLNPGYGMFTDMTNHWARFEVEWMAGRGLVRGKGVNTFEPEKSITRAEFVALLTRALNMGFPAGGLTPFSDVWPDDWYAGPIQDALRAGLLVETSGTFRPNDPIIREDMARMLTRACRIRGINIQAVSGSSYIEDWDLITSNARDDVALVMQLGLMKGRTAANFQPRHYTTRAEATVVIKRLIEILP